MKNTNSKLLLSVILSFAVLSFSNGQNKAIKARTDQLFETDDFIPVRGTVTSFRNFYVKNALVTSRKTRSNTFTDSLGRFEIMLPIGDILFLEANGFERIRHEVTEYEDEIEINMILKPGKNNEKMAVAYGHMKEQDMAYALEHYRYINSDLPLYSGIKELLQRELPGTRVVDLGNIHVFIRGNYSGSTGLMENNGAATFAIDGMIVHDVDDLNPLDVMSISLLKGHEATRIFGSQGVNGVVWINTKL